MTRFKRFLFTAAVSFCSLAVFCAVSYGYLKFVPPANRSMPVEKSESRVPYGKTPEDTILLCRFFNDDEWYLYLRFSDLSVTVLPKTDVILSPDFVCTFDRSRTVDLIDRVGGLEIGEKEGLYRLPGVQAADLMATRPDADTCRELWISFLRNARRFGLDRDDLSVIFKKSDPQISSERYTAWIPYLRDLHTTVKQS